MLYKRIMGLDVGDKRIGIALSDPMRITAQGLETYNRAFENDEADAEYIAGLCKRHDVEKIVCGLPRNMNGTIGPQAEKVKAFAELLMTKCDGTELVYSDERLTTVAADRAMMEAGIRREHRKDYVDQIAASLILQGYLDLKGRQKQNGESNLSEK